MRMLVFAPVVAATFAWGIGFIIGIRAYGLRLGMRRCPGSPATVFLTEFLYECFGTLGTAG